MILYEPILELFAWHSCNQGFWINAFPKQFQTSGVIHRLSFMFVKETLQHVSVHVIMSVLALITFSSDCPAHRFFFFDLTTKQAPFSAV